MVRAPHRTASVTLLLAIASSCAHAPARVPGAPPRSPSTVVNDGAELFFAVGLDGARAQRGGDFLPLEVALVNRGLPEKCTVSRESFRLELGDGRVVPLASVGEVRRDDASFPLDQRAGRRFRETIAAQFAAPTFTPLRLDFYPADLVTLARDERPLLRGSVLHGTVYARVPRTAWDQRLRLVFRPAGCEAEEYVLAFAP